MKILERLFNNKKDAVKKAELGRNEACWCGSGKKYKRCHLEKDENKMRMKTVLGPKRK
jgi:uncharacterized protein YecA (UPF0149 family)